MNEKARFTAGLFLKKEIKSHYMNPKVQITHDYINSLTPLTLVEDAQIAERFVGMYKATHNTDSDDFALDFYNREAMYFKQLIAGSEDLKQCTMFSLYGCLFDIIINGLSFDPAAKLLHIEAKSVNTAPKGQPDRWEKRAKNVVDAFGELALRIMGGQIKYCDDPVIVYEGDTFEPGYNEAGARYCLYRAKIPHASQKIIASFLKITRPDGSFDMPWFTEENFSEWKAASDKMNRGKGANALYSSGSDGGMNIGFLKTKTIKHAFKTYPKVKVIGGNTQLEEPENELPATIVAGAETPQFKPATVVPAAAAPAETIPPGDDAAFYATTTTPGSVTLDNDEF